jgi:catechol 2,3-dioxygenase-like lactoylglutathione lyase family enzyme
MQTRLTAPHSLLSLLTAAALIVTTLTLPAQQPAAPATTPSPNLAGIAHVALRVHSLDASVAFYEKLGFVSAFSLSKDGSVYESFIKINDHQFIELYPATPHDPQIGFLHLCFEGNDLQSVHDFYVARGLSPKDVRTAGAGHLLFTMSGPITPTGPQNIEYTQYMPGSLHSKDFGQHLGANRISTQLVSVAIATADPAAARTLYIDKLHFAPLAFGGKFELSLPGATSESVEFVPEQPLGFKARITFEGDKDKAAVILNQQAIPFVEVNDRLTFSDPDGNQILLRDPAITVLTK